ncbi:MAG: histidine kinase [Pseudomonadota bacterium]
MIVGSFFEYQAYSAAYSPQNLQAHLDSEIESFRQLDDQALRDGIADQGLEIYLDRLLRLRSANRELNQYVFERVSDPWAEITLKSDLGVEIGSISTPHNVTETARKNAISASGILALDAQVYQVQVNLYAPFSIKKLTTRTLASMARSSGVILFISAFMGLLCGIVSARYVTRRLDLMNSTTARWRRGQFDQMIEIGSGDELGAHARHLNAMASELESHLNLKQALAVSDERTRIARDLHDTVKQNLFALGLQLAAIRNKHKSISELPADFENNLVEAESIAREAQHDLVEIIDQLRPSEDAPKTLGAFLMSSAESLEKRLATKVSVTIDDDMNVPPLMEIDLLRIIRELTTNAVRHGHADLVDLVLSSRSGIAQLSVIDNGQGFDPAKQSDGLGLKSVEHRISTFPNGELRIDAEPNMGTRITVSWSQASDT